MRILTILFIVSWWRSAGATTVSYTHLPVAQINIVSVNGVTMDESLQPLLKTKQGRLFSASSVREDLKTLMRVGEFASIKAEVEPWFITDEEGVFQEAILLTFVVRSAPRISTVIVQSDNAFSDDDILDAARLSSGDVFFDEIQGISAQRMVSSWVSAQGHPHAIVEIDSMPSATGEEIWIRVDSGAPQTLDSITFKGDITVPERMLVKWAKEAGAVSGKPVNRSQLLAVEQEVRRNLAQMPGLFRRQGGWVEARVKLLPVIPTEQGSINAIYLVESGPRLEVEVTGLGFWRAKQQVVEALAIDERLRLTRGFIDEAPSRIVQHLQKKGYYKAAALVSVEDRGDTKILKVEVETGSKYTLNQMHFTGQSVLTKDELSAVMRQASDDILRINRVTDEALEKGVNAAKTLYSSHGYQGAALVESERTHTLRHWGRLPVPHPMDLFRVTTGSKLVGINFVVQEGGVTHLDAISVEGDIINAAGGKIADDLADMTGKPYSPTAIASVAKQMTDRYRDEGFLEVDVRQSAHALPNGDAQVQIVIEAHEQILLRSFTVRGNRRITGAAINNRVDVTLGAPLGINDINAVRDSIYQMRSFRSVQIDLLGEEPARDLLLTVDERPNWGLEVGAGVNTDQGIRTWSRATRRHLFHQPYRLELYGLIGADWRGEQLTDWKLDFVDPEWRAAISFVAPHFPMDSQELELKILIREEINESAWRLARSGVGLSFDINVSDKSTIRSSLMLEQRQLQEIDTGALLPDEPWLETLAQTEGDLPSAWRFQDSITLMGIYDGRDNPIQPTKGAIVSLLTEYSPNLGVLDTQKIGDVSYLKGEARITGYLPIGGLLLRLSGEVAHNRALFDGVLPLEERYRLGGTGSLRGFNPDAVGPHNQVGAVDIDWPAAMQPIVDYSNSTAPTRWVPTGGDTKGIGIVELLVPLPTIGLKSWEGYSAALFVDTGNVWNTNTHTSATSDTEEYDAYSIAFLRYSIGTGLRVSTPIGPLKLDFATNPNLIFADDSLRVILEEAFEEQPYRLHLSLGTLW